MTDSRWKSVRRHLPATVTTVLAVFLAWYAACQISNYRSFTPDDAFITYIYGRNLAEGHGLHYNPLDSAPTEGYSSLAHVLLTSLGYFAGIEGLTCTRAIGIVLFTGIAVVLGFTAARITSSPAPAAILLAFAALSLLFCVEDTRMHLTSGMETILFAAINAGAYAWALDFAARKERPSISQCVLGAAVLFLLVIGRPEGLILAALYLTAIPFAWPPEKESEKRAERNLAWANVSACWTVLVGAYLLWKWCYFGYILPNPYYVKTHHAIYGGAIPLLPGFAEVLNFLVRRFVPIAFLLLIAVLVCRRRPAVRAAALLIIPSVVIVIMYAHSIHEVAFAHRYYYPHLFPLVGLFAVTAAYGLLRYPRLLTTIAVAVLTIGPFVYAPGGETFLGWLRHPVKSATGWVGFRPDDSALGKMGLDLGETGLGQDATILLSGAGKVPYYSRFFTIDWIGLNTNQLSGRYPMSVEEVWRYIDARKPDVIYSLVPPATPGVSERTEDPAFHSFVLWQFLNGRACKLFVYWDRSRLEEMFYREMCYVRDHYTFGACYPLQARGMVLLYVRKDSHHKEILLRTLKNSPRADHFTDLAPDYVNDPRALQER